jgi:hypothetical protein
MYVHCHADILLSSLCRATYIHIDSEIFSGIARDVMIHFLAEFSRVLSEKDNLCEFIFKNS